MTMVKSNMYFEVRNKNGDYILLEHGEIIEAYFEDETHENKEWFKVTFYGQAIHKNRTWKDCFVVARENGTLDLVTEIRKIK